MKPRVLHTITVYNGRTFVPRAIESSMRMDDSVADIDVLVLDDASPEPGWSDELKEICRRLGAHYYLTPRNLGIPRNVSLGLLTAVKKSYDYVTINNSDVIFPKNLISVLVEASRHNNVGSVTAWSNNVSIYSVPNVDPDRFLSGQQTVDFVSESFADKFGASVFDIPAGISFAILIPTEVVRDVGVMDPVFGRGYCEETDWSLRSLQKGYRIVLAPGTFVYHQGRGSNVAAGLVSGAHSTVPENEAIIDLRYPQFRQQVEAFVATGILDQHKGEAIDHLLNRAARLLGYSILNGWKTGHETESYDQLRVEIMPDGYSPIMRYFYAGFEQVWPIHGLQALDNVIERFGAQHLRYNALDSSALLAELRAAGGEAPSLAGEPYPTQVW